MNQMEMDDIKTEVIAKIVFEFYRFRAVLR